jgi:hypothetical protein
MLRQIVYFCCYGIGELVSAMVPMISDDLFLDFGARSESSYGTYKKASRAKVP